MSAEEFHFLMMAFIRSGGLLALMPVFSGKSVPVVIRIAIAAFFAWVATGFVTARGPVPGDLPTLVAASMQELIIGLIMGLGVRLIFYAIELAGQIISTEMGLVMSSQIDPISQNSSTTVGTALFYLGSLLFLLSGSHHFVFAAFLRGMELSPPGTVQVGSNVGEIFVRCTGNIFLVAVQMAAPIMAINFVITMAFAVLGKAAPSINVFAESFAVRIIAGLALLSLTMALTAQLVLSQLRQAPELILRLIP